MNSLEEQLIDLQTRAAFQDDTIQSLSDTIAKQQQQLDQLTRMVKIINNQLKQFAPSDISDPADEPPPPHY